MKLKNMLDKFLSYVIDMDKLCLRSLIITFILGGIAVLGVAIMIIAHRMNGISIIESEITSIMLYIFRSVSITEFFLLLFYYAARSA